MPNLELLYHLPTLAKAAILLVGIGKLLSFGIIRLAANWVLSRSQRRKSEVEVIDGNGRSK